MNQTERQAELRQLMSKFPGKKQVERIRQMAAALHVKEATVRAWLLKNPYRSIPDRQLALLRDVVTGL